MDILQIRICGKYNEEKWRIDEKSKINILKIIYESINLEKCLTIFTMNFGQLNSFDKNDDFFDYKY